MAAMAFFNGMISSWMTEVSLGADSQRFHDCRQIPRAHVVFLPPLGSALPRTGGRSARMCRASRSLIPLARMFSATAWPMKTRIIFSPCGPSPCSCLTLAPELLLNLNNYIGACVGARRRMLASGITASGPILR